LGPAAPWPMAVDERWSSLHIDDGWHALYWVAEWPRLDVGPGFLTPLLLVGGMRTVSVTAAPVPSVQARRQVESARTADLADEELRRRAGFLSTARQRREAQGALQREAELADGHAEYRFCGFVDVAAADPRELAAACADVEQAAQQAHLELRRLYGQQRAAWHWTLPIGRGIG
ncbi:MAG TPA: SCO6880 family protein, partial [Acidimicrobiales bacterium]|nr:SCO6880 family protein [Acidimicrobiales bacterium]